jgi:chemosensory pili system protein ChpC
VNAEADELYSLLVPLSDDRLILPRACVAEVVRYTQPQQQPGSQNWMLGTINWNGRELPVTGRTRVVVFYSSTGKIKTGYFGVLTQGFPQLVRVNREVLNLDSTEGWPEDAPVLCRVKMINEYPLVPDLEALEDMIIEESLQA